VATLRDGTACTITAGIVTTVPGHPVWTDGRYTCPDGAGTVDLVVRRTRL
jgi:hypothetical protein